MHKDVFVRVCWAVAALFLAAPLVLRIVMVLSTPTSQLRDVVDFIYDDGYYYLTIAANLADTGRSTFDGQTLTNGYQPLWLLLLTCLAKLTGTQAHTFFVSACALIYALACSAPLLALLWWKSASRYVALCLTAGLAIVVLQQPAVFLVGLEPILMVPLAVPLLLQIEGGDLTGKGLRKLSALLAAAFLVRLDALALYVTAILWIPLFEALAGTLKPREVMTRMVKVALGLSTFVVPTLLVYAAVNEFLFGTPVPVSGLAKLIGAPHFSNWGAAEAFLGRWHSVALLVAIVLPLELLVRWSGTRPEALFYRSLAIVTTALCIQGFYYGAFSAWYVWPWYTYLVPVAMALLIARIVYLAWLLSTHKVLRFVAIAASALLGAWALNRSLALAVSSVPPQALATTSLKKWLGPGSGAGAETISFNQLSLNTLDDFFTARRHTVIAMGDRAGGLSYWGRNQVSIVQTEGLTLTIDYLKARAIDQGAEYLEHFPIQYLLVDREVIPTVTGADGQTRFVVPEPIQGRVNTAPVPTFCFPETAVRYRNSYSSAYGVNTRIAFEFAAREPCSKEALALMASVERGIGLRQYSLPGEYGNAGPSDKASEDRDRRGAIRASMN